MGMKPSGLALVSLLAMVAGSPGCKATASEAAGTAADAGGRTPAGDAGPQGCPPLSSSDSGADTNLASFPAEEICTTTGEAIVRYDCGSFVVVQLVGTDCRRAWVFDAATGALRATGQVCQDFEPLCERAEPGFRYPSECMDSPYTDHETLVCDGNPSHDAGGD